MRDVYAEYRQGKITWEEAYFTANNIAATVSGIPNNQEETSFDITILTLCKIVFYL